MSRYVPKTVFGIAWQGEDAQRLRAARLLASGFDAEGAAALTGLSVAEVRQIAATTDLNEFKVPENPTR